jgi:hypothetical protein
MNLILRQGSSIFFTESRLPVNRAESFGKPIFTCVTTFGVKISRNIPTSRTAASQPRSSVVRKTKTSSFYEFKHIVYPQDKEFETVHLSFASRWIKGFVGFGVTIEI